MAEFTLPLPEELEIDEQITINFKPFGNERKWQVKTVHNLDRRLDDKVVSATFEALVDQIIDDEQSEFRKYLAPLYDEDKISTEILGEVFGWILEERQRLVREATAKKTGRPTGGQ